jgi:hypothetical protein
MKGSQCDGPAHDTNNLVEVGIAERQENLQKISIQRAFSIGKPMKKFAMGLKIP